MSDFTPKCYVLVYDSDILQDQVKLEVVHMVGYPEIPSVEDLEQLQKELETDPEFEYLKQINYAMMFCNSGMLMDCIPNRFDGAINEND